MNNKIKNNAIRAKFVLRVIFGKLLRFIHRPNFPINPGNEIYVHLGCGAINHPLFINVDGIPARHVHYVGGIDRLSMFSDESVDLVYACHCLEHFQHSELPGVLDEWKRVLKKGGILRISVPDFDSMLQLYLDSGRDITYIHEPVLGGQDYRYNYHKSIFNKAYLAKLLQKAGFSRVSEWVPGSSSLTTFDDWSGKEFSLKGHTYRVSLNLEAVK